MTTVFLSRQASTRILLCHADPGIGQGVKDVLQRSPGLQVTSARDARTVIEKIRLGHFHVLITGEQLPDLDAWRLARMIQTGRFCLHAVPILLVCTQEEIPLLSARAAQYQVRVLSAAHLERLPEAIEACQARDTKPRLLMIEDDRRSAELARACLDSLFQVEVAGDGESGLAAYEARRHDLVLLDLALPGMPGEAVLGHIRRIDAAQPIVIVTANTSLDAHATLVFQGALDFLVKPFDIGALREACVLAMEQRGYTALRAERERAGVTLRDLFGRISAAEHANSTGRNLAATQHLKRALATYRPAPLTDEEWRDLISEF
jgi:DNA-binding response OmpR family regulator